MWSSRPNRAEADSDLVGGEMRRAPSHHPLCSRLYPSSQPQHPMNPGSTIQAGRERFIVPASARPRSEGDHTGDRVLSWHHAVRPTREHRGEAELFTGGRLRWVLGVIRLLQDLGVDSSRCAAFGLWRGADPAGHDRQHASLPRRLAVGSPDAPELFLQPGMLSR